METPVTAPFLQVHYQEPSECANSGVEENSQLSEAPERIS